MSERTVTATVAFVVSKGKKELRRIVARVDGGELATASDDQAAEPDVTFTMSEVDADALREGSLALSVGFMRGQIKMAGDFGKVLQFLPLTHGSNPPVRVSSLF
ncbi:MAG: hypothetical protein JWL83_2560 [Actinomycetia bacterium]|nr:hypothetical protein [Actinomycetes bacterium]